MRKLPTEVWVVQRIAPETERKVYYSKKMVRLYGSKADAKTFVDANRGSTFNIWRADVGEWQEEDPWN